MLRHIAVAVVFNALLLSAPVVARADPEDNSDSPIEVTGDSNDTVDVRVKHDRRVPGEQRRPKGVPRRPTVVDVPADLPGHCLEPDAVIDLTCPLAGAGAAAAGPNATPVALAIVARGRLTLPAPVPRLRPLLTFADGRTGGLTGAPLWLWLDPTHWTGDPLTTRVQAGPVWASVAAAPVRQSWTFGDNTTLTCEGPGTPLTDTATALNGSPDCGHTYRATSADTPGDAFALTVRVTWAVTWVGSDGDGGTLAPFVVTTTVPYVVRQARATLVAPN